MSAEDITIPATDGLPLHATLYGDPSTARALVTINPATAVMRGFYKPFAEFLVERGCAAVAFDWRHTKGARMRDWGDKDLAGVLAWAHKEFPTTPLAGFGHSAGGQMLCLAAGAERYRAFVGVAAQSGYWRHWPRPLRYARAAQWFVGVPVVTAFGDVPGFVLGQPLPRGVAREWARWCRSPDYILRDDTVARRAAFARIRCPVLAYSFFDDSYGPRSAIDWWAAQLTGAQVTRRHVTDEKAGHFGFFRPRFRETLWVEALSFLDAAL